MTPPTGPAPDEDGPLSEYLLSTPGAERIPGGGIRVPHDDDDQADDDEPPADPPADMPPDVLRHTWGH